MAGRQPPELTAQALRTGRLDIPVDWAAQKRALGFAQPPEHAPINSGPATTLLLFKANARSIYKLSPPPKVQTERNLQNSRLNPDETGSPVDSGVPDSGQMRVFHADDERILKTEDSLAERVEFELTGDFVADQ